MDQEDDSSTTWTDWSPLHTAAFGNNVGLLLEHSSRVDVDTKDRVGRTPLQVAVENFRLDAISSLVELGASFEFVEINGLRGVAVFEHPHYFDLGVQLLPVVGPMSRRFLLTAACHAAFTNQPEVLELVVQNRGFDGSICNDYDPLGLAPVHYSVIGGSLECTSLLLSNGGRAISPSRPDFCLPFHYACSKGLVEIFNALLLAVPMSDSVLNSQDAYGHTSFHLAVYNGCWDFLASFPHLLSLCDKDHKIIDSKGHTLQGLLFKMRPFIPLENQANIPCLSSDEANWLLHSAVSDRDGTLAFFALSQKANPNCFDLMQQTPLIHAAKVGLAEICSVLLENGADQTIKDWSGQTPLHYAARNGHVEVVRMLSQFPGTDWLCLSMDQCTPLDLAFYGGHLAVAEECLLTMTDHQHSSYETSTWMKTLSLAVSVATRSILQDMSTVLFPSDWVELLVASTSNCFGKPLIGTHRQESHPKLRSYSPYPSFSICLSDLKNPSNLEQKRKELVESIFNEKHTNFKRIFPSSVKGESIRNSFINHCHEKYYPIHQALLAKNQAGFLYLFEQAQLAGLLDQFLAYRGLSGMSVAEFLVRVFPNFASELDIEEAVCGCLLQVCPLGDGITFPWALIYHIVSECFVTKRISLPSPLNKWPIWLVLRQLKSLSTALGIYENVDLEDFDQVCLLMKNIIEVEGIDVTKSVPSGSGLGGYGPLLFTAVSNGVPPELLQALLVGTKHLDLSEAVVAPCQHKLRTKLKPNIHRWVLTEALIRGYDDLASTLLAYGDLTSLLSTGAGSHTGEFPTTNFQQELLYSIQFTYSKGMFHFTWELLSSFPHDFFRYFLLSRHGNRLLYICLTNEEALDLGAYLLDSYISVLSFYICDNAVTQDQSNEASNLLSCLKKILFTLSHSRRRSSWSMNLKSLQLVACFIQFIVHAKETHPLFPILHQLCGCGQLDILTVMLDHCHNREEAFSSVVQGFTPLYSAAVGGHLEIVKKLLATFPSLINYEYDPCFTPHIGSLLYLAYVNVTVHPKGQTVCKCFKQLDIFPPYISSNDLCELKDVSLFRELFEILSPPSYHHEVDEESADRYVNILFSIPDLSPLENLLDEHVISQVIEESHQKEFKSNQKCINGQCNVSDFYVNLSFSYDKNACSMMFCNILEKLSCKFPPFNPVNIVRKGYHQVLWDSVLFLHSLAGSHEKFESILNNWQRAVFDVIRYGFGKLAVHLLKHLTQISEFNVIMELKALLTHAVGSEEECCIDVLEYLLDFDPTTETLISVINYAARKGNLESLKVLLTHNRKAVESQFLSILSSAVRSGQSNVVNYFYEHHYSDCLESSNPDNEFWLIVFKNAAHSGHEQLALHALSKMPFNFMAKLSSSAEVLYYVCWWGMVEVLSSLCVDRDDVFFKTFNSSSPIEASLCNGHIGKLSDADGFPLLLDVMQSPDHMKAIKVDLIKGFGFGWHRTFSSNTSSTKSEVLSSNGFTSLLPSHVINKLSYIYHFLNALASARGHEIVDSYIRIWGKQTGGVFHYLYQSYSVNVLYLAVAGGCSDTVQSVSQILFDSGIFNDFVTLKLFKIALLNDNIYTLQILSQFCDLNSIAEQKESKSGDNILHFVAQFSQSYECTEVMITMIKGCIIKLVNSLNYCGMTPLMCAVELGGKHYVVRQLMDLSVEIPEPEREKLMKARGWFSVMMKHNAARLTSSECEGEANANPNFDQCFNHSFPSLRSKSVLAYYTSFKNYHPGIACSMMDASCGFLPLNGLEHTDGDGHQGPSFNETTWTRKKLLEFVNSKEITRWCLRGHFEPAITVLRHMLSSDEADLLKSVCIENMYLNACARGCLKFIEYIFDVRSLLHSSALTNSAVTDGFVTAIGLGHLEIAAYIMLNGGVSQQQLKGELLKHVKPSLIVNLIFFGSADDICNALCDVVKQGQSSRAVVPQVWLMHNWQMYQTELLKSRVQSVSRMMYSQKIRLSTVHSTLLSVDLSSFPTLDYVFCPLSQPVVVLSSCVTHLVPIWKQEPLLPMDGINEDSIITLSCAYSGLSPSFDNSGYYCNIVLTFDTQNSLFQWPTSDCSDEPLQVSNVLSPGSISPLYSVPYELLIQITAKSCLLNSSDIPVPVKLHCEPVIGFDGCPESLLSSLAMCVNDVLTALRLIDYGYSLYTELGLIDSDFLMHYQHKQLPSKSSLKHFFTEVLIELDFGISRVQSFGQEKSLKVHVGIEADSFDGCTCRCPSSNEIVSQVCSSVAMSEMKDLSNALSTYLSSLPLGISVYHSLPEENGVIDLSQPTDLSLNNVIILKFLPLIKKFINLFVRSIASFESLLSKVQGIKIVFSMQYSKSYIDPSSCTLFTYILDILPHRRYRTVSIAIQDLLREADLSSNYSSTAVAVASCLDISENVDFFSTLEGGYAMICNAESTCLSKVPLKCEQSPNNPMLYKASAAVSSVHVQNSPLSFVCKKDKSPWQGERSAFVAAVGSHVQLIVSHPGGGCWTHLRPRLKMSNYVSVRENRSPSRSSAKSCSTTAQGLVHHIGLVYKKNAITKWTPTERVFLKIYNEDGTRPSLSVGNLTSMGHGAYQIFLESRKPFVGGVVAVCSLCQCALKVHTQGGHSLLSNVQFLVRPSSDWCKVQDKSCLEVTAGSQVSATMLLQDCHPKKRNVTPTEHLPDVLLTLGPLKLSCGTRVISPGLLALVSPTLETAGQYTLSVKHGSIRSVVDHVTVKSAEPYPPNCTAVGVPKDGGVFEVELGLMQVTVHVRLCDRYGNQCDAKACRNMICIKAANENETKSFKIVPSNQRGDELVGTLTLEDSSLKCMDIEIMSQSILDKPAVLKYTFDKELLLSRCKKLSAKFDKLLCGRCTAILKFYQSRLLARAFDKLQNSYFNKTIQVRFGKGKGKDESSRVIREFYQLLSMEIVNHSYALYFCYMPSGHYKPCPNLSINNTQLLHFEFLWKIPAKIIAEGHNLNVRFTSSVDKTLTSEEMTFEYVKEDDITLYKELQNMLSCEMQSRLDEIKSKLASKSESYGTMELIGGGRGQSVTMENKDEYVSILVRYFLSECIYRQLQAMRKEFTDQIPSRWLEFTHKELERLLTGDKVVTLDAIKPKTVFKGYREDETTFMAVGCIKGTPGPHPLNTSLHLYQ